MENGREAGGARQKLKNVILVFFSAVVLFLVIIFLRGPYISDILKSVILPELEDVSGQKLTTDKIFVNLFPLFVEAKGLKVLNADGTRMLSAGKVKGYVNPAGLLGREIVIRRLAVDGLNVTTSRQDIEKVIRHVKAYLEKEKKSALKAKINVIDVSKGNLALRDSVSKGSADIKGLSTELILGQKKRIRVASSEVRIKKEGWPNIMFNIDTSAVLRKGALEIDRLSIGAYGSKLKAAGSYSQEGGGLKTQITLLMDSMKRIFSLSRKGEGKISAKGTIRLAKDKSSNFEGLKNIFVDVQMSGDFYLQTLMEVLKVKEKLEGLVDFQGEIRGPLSDISGKGKASLRGGNLFGVDIDSLTCDILYRDDQMKFGNAGAVLYGGRALANASINLPVVNSYSLGVKFSSIDSRAALKLIGWEPDIPIGKVDGELSSSGSRFNPEGWFAYKSLSPEQRALIKGNPPVDNFLNRIRDIKGNYSLRDGIVALRNLKLNTLLSAVDVNGIVDLSRKALRLSSRLATENVSDLTLPYYKGVKGRGVFSGDIAGPFDNPNISGGVKVSDVVVEGYRLDSFTSEFSYDKKLLDIRESALKSPGEENRVRGRILFPQAKELFDLVMPVYDLRVSFRNAQFGDVVQIFYKDVPTAGRLDADIKIRGKDNNPDITGKASVGKGSFYKIPFDSATGTLTYEGKEFSLRDLEISRESRTCMRKASSLPAADSPTPQDRTRSF